MPDGKILLSTELLARTSHTFVPTIFFIAPCNTLESLAMTVCVSKCLSPVDVSSELMMYSSLTLPGVFDRPMNVGPSVWAKLFD